MVLIPAGASSDMVKCPTPVSMAKERTREPASHAHAVVDRHPVFAVPFFLSFFLAHERGELLRRILGKPPETAIV